MGNDDLPTSLAHIVLCGVAGHGLSKMSGRSYTHPGMHANFLIHGIVGFLNFQSGTFNYDFSTAYEISLKASKYLAVPCLMGDLYRGNDVLSILHLVSGILPFTLAVAGQENPALADLVVAANLVSLVYYSVQNKREWGYYTAGAGVIAYFAAPRSGVPILYPLCLAAMEYCAFRLFHIRFDIVGRR